jgi:hypothetical protein
MRKLKIFLLAMLTAGTLLSCSDNTKNTLSVDPENPETPAVFSASATESFTYSIATNQEAWDAVSDQTWCIVTKAASSFTLTAEQYGKEEERSATVTVTAGGAKPFTISVAQSGFTAADGFIGTITVNGESKDIASAGFYHYESESGVNSYKVLLSPEKVEGMGIGQLLELMEIEVPFDLMGSNINLETDVLYSNNTFVAVAYRSGFANVDKIANERIQGSVRLEKSEEGNFFKVEVSNVKLHDGRIISCSAIGVIDTEYEYYTEGHFVGTTDFAWGIYDGVHQFSTARLQMMHSNDGTSATQLTISGKEGDEYTSQWFEGTLNEWQYLFTIALGHPEKYLTSGTYKMAYYDGLEATNEPEGGFELLTGSAASASQVVPSKGNDLLTQGTQIQGGTVDIEVSDRYIKITLHDNVKDAYNAVWPGEFIFDYTNGYPTQN